MKAIIALLNAATAVALSLVLLSLCVAAQVTDDSNFESDLQIFFFKENSSHPSAMNQILLKATT
jgi:hypothetical protein